MAHRSPLERLLGLFTVVRPGEGATAIALALNVFLILTTYYLIKPVREAMILSVPGGPELKSYAAAGQAMLLLFAVILSGLALGRLSVAGVRLSPSPFPRRPSAAAAANSPTDSATPSSRR